MIKLKFNQKLLTFCMERDGTEQEEKYENLNRDTKIKFKCKCGREDIKTFILIYKNGAFCKDCTKNNAKDKKKATCMKNYGVYNPLQSQEIKDKIKATCMEKYGVAHPFQSKKVKNKMKATWKGKYGLVHPSQNQEIKDKKKATCMENYGVEHPLQSQKVKDKIKATCIEKYGVEHPSQSQEIKDKMKATCIEKYGVEHPFQSQKVKDKMKATCIKNYGVNHLFQSQEIKDKKKATWKEKYGVDHPSQNPEIAEKSSKNAYKKKEVFTPSGKVITLQGYEPQAYKILLETYTEEEILNSRTDVPEIWWFDDKDKRRRYFVDFYIPKDNLMIEIKSKRTFKLDDKKEKIEKTLQASNEAGYNIELWIMNEKGDILEKIVKN